MEIGKLPMAIVGITIAVIVCAVVLIPVVQESTTAYDTFTNEGYFAVDKITSTDEYSAKWDHTQPAKFTVNDNTFDIIQSSELTVTNLSIVLGEEFFLRYFPSDKRVALYYDGVGIIDAQVSDSSDMTLVYDGTTLTVTSTASPSTPRVITTDEFYTVNDKGDYTMKSATVDSWMNSDSLIVGCGRTSIIGDIVGTYVYGSIDDIQVSIWRGSVTASDIVVNKTNDTSHIDLYKFSSVDFTVTNESEQSGSISYSYVVVPAQVTAERSVHPDATTTQLINVIPILVIIGIVMLAVGTMIYYRR